MASPALTPSLIAALAFSNFVTGMGAFIVVGTVEPVADGLSISTAQAGTLLSYYAFAYAILSPILVTVTGKLSRRLVLATGLSVFGVAALLGALAPSFEALAASRVLAAVGACVLTPVTAAIAAGLAPPERRARTLALVFSGVTLSQVIGVPAGSWLAYTFGWRTAMASVAMLSLPALALQLARVPRGVPFQAARFSDLGVVLRSPTMLIATLFTATFMTAVFALYTFFAPLLSEGMGFGRGGITLTLFLFGIGAVIGNLAGGVLSDRLGPMRLLTGVTLILVPMTAFYSFLPVNPVVFFAWMLVWSSIGWSFGAAQQARLVSLCGAKAPVALALHAAFIFGGSALGASLGAAVAAQAGYGALGLTAALTMAAAFLHLQLSRRLPAPA